RPTMKDRRNDSRPRVESNALTFMYVLGNVFRQALTSVMTPAASRMSNIGGPNISQYVLRGCGSSVYSTDTAQPFPRHYSTCLAICSSLRSGRKEKVPCVTRMERLLRLRPAWERNRAYRCWRS